MTRIVATSEAVQKIRARGGGLWVWTRTQRCCGGLVRLESATEPRGERRFHQIASYPVDVYLASALAAPDELHVETTRHGRLQAFWNGCAWVA